MAKSGMKKDFKKPNPKRKDLKKLNLKKNMKSFLRFKS